MVERMHSEALCLHRQKRRSQGPSAAVAVAVVVVAVGRTSVAAAAAAGVASKAGTASRIQVMLGSAIGMRPDRRVLAPVAAAARMLLRLFAVVAEGKVAAQSLLLASEQQESVHARCWSYGTAKQQLQMHQYTEPDCPACRWQDRSVLQSDQSAP